MLRSTARTSVVGVLLPALALAALLGLAGCGQKGPLFLDGAAAASAPIAAPLPPLPPPPVRP